MLSILCDFSRIALREIWASCRFLIETLIRFRPEQLLEALMGTAGSITRGGSPDAPPPPPKPSPVFQPYHFLVFCQIWTKITHIYWIKCAFEVKSESKVTIFVRKHRSLYIMPGSKRPAPCSGASSPDVCQYFFFKKKWFRSFSTVFHSFSFAKSIQIDQFK